ncbi:MAG: geranyl transferase [Gemmataceae bacterium]|nr:geranyl transferase [Gemmataceae bacterium]
MVQESLPYLTALTVALVEGLERWPRELLEPHRRFLLAQQQPDGGFRGRSENSDLYYTSFGLRALAVLQAWDTNVAQHAAAYLRSRLAGTAQLIDFFAWLSSAALLQWCGCDLWADAPPDWQSRLATLLERFRTPDGGYGRLPGATHGSTYVSFLVSLTAQLLDIHLPEAERLIKFVHARRGTDGGFVDVAVQKRSSTNPTAAALAILQLYDALDSATMNSAGQFLLRMYAPEEGGWRAHDRIPLADLLSTFTAAWTLTRLGWAERLAWDRLGHYAWSCALPAGGFLAGCWDNQPDVEYTFYGLGVLALTAVHLPQSSIPYRFPDVGK